MGYSNVSKPNGFLASEESVGHAHVVSRPIPNVRQASAGGNASTDLAVGDAYGIDGNGYAFRAGPNDVVRGVVVGFDLKPNPLVMNANGPISVDYITGAPASGSWPNIIGVEDNKCIFECQADTFAALDVLGSFNLADAAPDSIFRISQQTINIGGGAGVQFKAVGLKQSPADNSYGANARIEVMLLQATP